MILGSGAAMLGCSVRDSSIEDHDESASALSQHQNANAYAFWDFHGADGFRTIDQVICIDRKAPSTFWAQQWYWSGQSYGGYIGLQTDVEGSSEQTAIFSLWNADKSDGARCLQFGNEGDGWSCRSSYRITESGCYRLRVARLDAEPGGQWWGGWVRDEASGVDLMLGKIRVAARNTGMQPPNNFSEYLGMQRGCDEVPISIARFTQPAANSIEPWLFEHFSVFDRSTRGDCVGGDVESIDMGWTRAARITLGGPRSSL